ncbi:hypothetical protein [Dethiothermospora halolimnae]|uniref:hypothetical protein n=1 Tax=Dethiothermospora halolimnae TaxID=3114390 RepID=UPI003CCC0BF4
MEKLCISLFIFMLMFNNGLYFNEWEDHSNKANVEVIALDMSSVNNLMAKDNDVTKVCLRISKKVPIKIDGVEKKDAYIEPQFYATIHDKENGGISVYDVKKNSPKSNYCNIRDYSFEKLSSVMYRTTIDFFTDNADGHYSDSMEVTFIINGINDVDVNVV